VAEAIISDLCSASIVRLKTRAIGAVSSGVVAESRGAAAIQPNHNASLTCPCTLISKLLGARRAIASYSHRHT